MSAATSMELYSQPPCAAHTSFGRPGFRSWPVAWTRKWAVELQKRVITVRQACVQESASSPVKPLFSLVRVLARPEI
jgi:hypothetical protein